ncbi:protein RADIALIS-like 3 [Typha latifolia]|uniref:protein RADIALIS-like 3 n=1 Tax=Typha latifolia TaxID=4733 RepID=UPI003C2D1FC0
MEDANGSAGFVSEWSWEENKLFEMALAVIDEEIPDRWEVVSSMIGSKKSAEEVRMHYEVLLKDLDKIESFGTMDDHELNSAANEDIQSIFWTDEDQELFGQLSLD